MDKKDNQLDIFDLMKIAKKSEEKIFDRDILAKILRYYLKDITEEELVLMLYSKYEAIIDFAKLCRGEKKGQKISMLFNPHRYSTPVKGRISVIDAFKTDTFFDGMARTIRWKETVSKESLYSILNVGINGSSCVYDFLPHVAREIYIQHNARNILDPCGGWGGRMIGAASIGAYYHAFEPSTKTYDGLLKLGEFLKQFNTGFDFKVECLPFEDAKLTKKYDFAFTSPPYFDTERYSTEETNSCNRYKNFDEWKDKFYIPFVKKSIKYSDTFIINVGDRKYPLKTILFENFNVVERKYMSTWGGVGLGKKKDEEELFYQVS